MPPQIRLFNEDCLPAMKKMKDNQFQLSLVDPPYGIDDKLMNGSGHMRYSPMRLRYKEKRWDTSIPPDLYFEQLFRVSSKQIICGGNYFDLPPSRGIIAWVKPTMRNHPHFSQFEMIWTSSDKPAKCVYQHTASMEEKCIHPTQKPVALYRWLLDNYAKPGDKILDTHGGSMSIAIACYDMGFDLELYEIDLDYFKAGKERLERYQAQGRLF